MAAWTSRHTRRDVQDMLRRAGRAGRAGGHARGPHRARPDTAEWGLVADRRHAGGGTVRVDGVPVHLRRPIG